MLWMKAWFETRWRLALMTVLLLLVFALALAKPSLSQATMNAALFAIGLDTCFGCVILAGAGVQTQPIFQTVRGVHASMTFTLSLPVTRLRLLYVRAALGLAESIGFIVAVCCAEWLIFRSLLGNPGVLDLLKLIFEYAAFGVAVHCVSIFFATVFDLIFQMYATLLAMGFLWFITSRLHLPRSIDIFRLMIGDPALVTHTLLCRIAVSCSLALISLLAAARIVQTREY